MIIGIPLVTGEGAPFGKATYDVPHSLIQSAGHYASANVSRSI